MSEESHYADGNSVAERVQAMMQWTPHARALGLELVKLEGAHVWGKVPYKPELIGDPETGVIAGGVITTLLDQLSGIAAVLALKQPAVVATIDLRIDYMRPAVVGSDVLAEAHCYKVGRNVAFIRSVAYEDSPENPIAHGAGTFMINSRSRMGANLREKKS